MKKKENLLTLWVLSAFLLLIALTLSTVTFAWFTANRKVQTDKITAKSGSTNISLEISRSRNPFKAEKDEDGTSVAPLKSPGKWDRLMPVSTGDLTHFWASPNFDPTNKDGNFVPDEEETYYYHDTVYLRAIGEDMPKTTKLDLFLSNDPVKYPIVRAEGAENEKILTAARLGLKIEGNPNPVIVKLSDEDSGGGKTNLNGKVLPAGQVLGWEDGKPVGKGDPAVSLSALRFDPANPGKTPLVTMELDKIYQVDVYFYLEGCDPDCVVDKVGLTEAFLSLAFFGMQQQ